MTFQQLRCFCQIVDSDFNVSRAAARMSTSQPGVSKMIAALEAEVGSLFFVRSGNRLTGLTDVGLEALTLARRVLNDGAAISQLGVAAQSDMEGVLRLGTTHFHARYPLLGILTGFAKQHPSVSLELTQGSPVQITNWLDEGSIDIGVSTVPGKIPESLVALDAYEVSRCVIAAIGHPVLRLRKVTLAGLAEFPVVAYDSSFSTGRVFEQAFEKLGLQPKIVMRATDANIAKAYVAAGMGIALIPDLAFDPKLDTDIAVVTRAPRFPSSLTTITFRKGQILKPYARKLIQLINPSLGTELLASRRGGSIGV